MKKPKDLNDPQVRKQMWKRHPVVTQDYRVSTVAIESAYKIIRSRFVLRRTSIYRTDPPQTGKTECALAVQQLLEVEFPTCYGVVVSADGHGTKTFGLVRDIAAATGVLVRSRDPYKIVMSRIVSQVCTEVQSRGGSQFWLIIDEMHLVSEQEFKQLLTLQNALRLVTPRISMTVIGFAQPEIESRRTALVAVDARHLVARFLSEGATLGSCNKVSALQRITRALDKEKEYPIGSGWSYVRFFLPRAFEAGFRLTTYAQMILDALAKEAGGIRPIPMHHTMRTLEALLLLNAKHDDTHFKLDEAIVLKAVRSSHLRDFVASTRSAGGE